MRRIRSNPARDEKIAQMYREHMPAVEIAAALDVTQSHVECRVRKLREKGWDIPYHYASSAKRFEKVVYIPPDPEEMKATRACNICSVVVAMTAHQRFCDRCRGARVREISQGLHF